MKKYLEKYERTKPEDLKLHNTDLVAGNQEAKLTITIFNDFLCSYCYKLFKLEEHLLTKFKNKINFKYYNYPLDKQCNFNVRGSVYKNSCIASKAMLASSQLGIFEEYIKEHFKNYKKLKSEYSLEKALIILSNTGNDSMRNKFIQLIDSESISTMLQRDIKSAIKNKINATPTIFLANKRIRGIIPVEVFEIIIARELQKQENNTQNE